MEESGGSSGIPSPPPTLAKGGGAHRAGLLWKRKAKHLRRLMWKGLKVGVHAC